MKPKVWIGRPLREEFRRIENEVEFIEQATMNDLPGSTVAIIGAEKTNGAFMDKAGPNLKLICRPGIGVDTVDIPAATERGILVINTPDAPTESTAEHAVAILMALAKRVMVGDMYLRGNKNVARPDMYGTELLNRTLSVYGYGRIGRRVAEICALGLKMRVLVYDPFIDINQPTPEGITLVDNDEILLTEADFLSLHTPLTPQTRHLINAEVFAKMKKGSYLINASRGPVVDEAALIKTLQDGHLAGAALDVFDPEPPKPDNPLLKMPNVVVTPHIASFTDNGVAGMMNGVADQIVQVLHGEKPPYLLNPEAWPGRAG